MSVAAHFQSTPASVDLLRTGQVFLPAGDTTSVVIDAALTGDSLIVATLGRLGSGAVSAQTGVSVLQVAGQFTIVIPAVAAATGQFVNFAVLKY